MTDNANKYLHRAFTTNSFLRLAFEYGSYIKYYAHSKVNMDKECANCNALKFKNEPAGMCRASGKVQLPEIETPPEPSNGLLIGTDPDSNLFLKSIRTFNSCFQMTSFGATEIVKNNAANGQQFNSKSKAEFIIEWAHCYQCQTNHIHFYKFTLWAVRTPIAHLPIKKKINIRCFVIFMGRHLCQCSIHLSVQCTSIRHSHTLTIIELFFI